MKRISGLVLICLMAITGQAQDNIINDPNVSERKTGGFTGISVSGSIQLNISQGTETKVLVSASDKEWADRIETFVKDNVLHIRLRDGYNNWNFNMRNIRLRAYVSAPVIKLIEASGSGHTQIQGAITTDELTISSSGSGGIDGVIKTEKLNFEKSGSGSSHLSGRATVCNIETSGSGNLISPDLIIEKCDISTSGSGNVEVTVNKEVSAETSGSGNIRLRGDALISNISNSGSGRLKRI